MDSAHSTTVERVHYNINWDKVPLDPIKKSMVPMSNNLKQSSYLKYVKEYGSDVEFLDNWYVYQFPYKNLQGYMKKIADDIGDDFQPFIRFYYLPAGREISPHKDFRTQCGVNFVRQREFSPITVEGVDYPYGAFLFNGLKLHGVRECKVDRLTLQVGFHRPYNEVWSKLEKNGLFTKSNTEV